MTSGQIVKLLVAVVVFVCGGALALAGMGYLGGSGDTSSAWAILGSLLAGFGVALGITVFQRRD